MAENNEQDGKKQAADEELQKVTLTQDVLWGSTKYRKGQRIIPDREFYKYLKKHNLIQELNKSGETQPDVRTRTSKSFWNYKSE